jgi:hypothetical protein
MSADQHFAAIMSGIGGLFAIMGGILALIYRIGNKWGIVSQKMTDLETDIASIGSNMNKHLEWHMGQRR